MEFFKRNNLKKTIPYLLGLGILLFLFVFMITSAWIGFSVKKRCQIAQERYEGDCVSSLVAFLEDEQNDFRSRNSAIWALGQLGDGRALPVLKKYYTGNIPDREPLDAGLSQYELKKAIKLIESGFNISAFGWR